jgi:plastocyanin
VDYDHVEPTRELVPIAAGSPPPGVHLPGPSFRPVLGAFATGGIMLGIVFGGVLLVIAILFFVVVLLGWLWDARREYTKTVEADTSGHLENLPDPGYPSRLVGVFLFLAVVAVVIDLGIGLPASGDGGEGAGGPPPSGEASDPPASGEPGESGEPGQPGDPDADVVIHALNIAFLESSFTAPAGAPFTIGFVNEDPAVPHNVEIKDEAGASVYQGEIFPGVETRIYDVPALEAGTYPYICTVHPNMTGTATIE